MTFYGFSVFLHVLGAGGLFAATAIEWIIFRQVRRAATTEAVREAFTLMPLATRIGGPSMIAVLLTGGHMAGSVWSFSMPWIYMGLSGMVVAAALGGAVSMRRMKAIAKSAGAEPGPLSPALTGLIADPLLPVSLRIRTGLLAGIIFLMTVRPELLGSLVALAAFAVLGYAAGWLRRK